MAIQRRNIGNGDTLARAASGILAFLPLAACSFFLDATKATAPLAAQAVIFTCALAVSSFAYDVLKKILVIRQALVRPLLRRLTEMYLYIAGYFLLVGALALIQLKVSLLSSYLPWLVVALTATFMWLATRSFVDTVLDYIDT